MIVIMDKRDKNFIALDVNEEGNLISSDWTCDLNEFILYMKDEECLQFAPTIWYTHVIKSISIFHDEAKYGKDLSKFKELIKYKLNEGK